MTVAEINSNRTVYNKYKGIKPTKQKDKNLNWKKLHPVIFVYRRQG